MSETTKPRAKRPAKPRAAKPAPAPSVLARLRARLMGGVVTDIIALVLARRAERAGRVG